MNNNGGWKAWVIGVLTAISLGAGAALYNKVSAVEGEQKLRSGRIATLEAKTSLLGERLERIENKLDRLLERGSSGR